MFQDVVNSIYHFYQSLLRRCDLLTLCHLADLLLGFSTSSSLTPEMESTSNEDRARLLQAVHDPPEPSPPQTMQPAVTNGHGPTKVVAAPIKFASLDLWSPRCPNFASCDEIMPTEEGKKSTSRHGRSDDMVVVAVPWHAREDHHNDRMFRRPSVPEHYRGCAHAGVDFWSR